MSYHGDIRLGDTIDFKFTTVDSSGLPATLSGSPAVAAYVNNGTTEITAGVTLTVDFDGRVGLNHVRVVASGGNGFAAGSNVQAVITAGTVGGVSVVGYEVGAFSIEARSALTPTALVGGRMDSSVGAIATNAITTAAIADGALTAAKFAAGAFDAVWTTSVRALTTFGTLVADVTTAVWAAAARTLTAFTGFSINTEVTAIKTKTDNLPPDPADASDIAAAFAAVPAAVWAAGTRTLTSFGTLVADMATAVWTSVSRTLTAFGFTVPANVTQIGGDVDTLARLKRVTDSEVLGTSGAGSTTTSIVTSSLSPAAVVIDQFKGRVVLFDRNTTTTALRGQGTRITANTAGGVLTVEALSNAPVSGDTFAIV